MKNPDQAQSYLSKGPGTSKVQHQDTHSVIPLASYKYHGHVPQGYRVATEYVIGVGEGDTSPVLDVSRRQYVTVFKIHPSMLSQHTCSDKSSGEDDSKGHNTWQISLSKRKSKTRARRRRWGGSTTDYEADYLVSRWCS